MATDLDLGNMCSFCELAEPLAAANEAYRNQYETVEINVGDHSTYEVSPSAVRKPKFANPAEAVARFNQYLEANPCHYVQQGRCAVVGFLLHEAIQNT